MARGKRNGGYFIQKAIKKPGSFHKYCKNEGFRKANASCIRHGLASPNRLTRERANFARNLARLRPR